MIFRVLKTIEVLGKKWVEFGDTDPKFGYAHHFCSDNLEMEVYCHGSEIPSEKSVYDIHISDFHQNDLSLDNIPYDEMVRVTDFLTPEKEFKDLMLFLLEECFTFLTVKATWCRG